MIKPYIGTCKECKRKEWIRNSRGICVKCVYKKSHNGKGEVEYLTEKENNKPKKIHKLSRKPIKSTEKTLEKRKKTKDKDKETYLKVFNSKPPVCEECNTSLPDIFEDENGHIVMVGQYSHILTKGAYPEFRHNPKNFNRLCNTHHDVWEFGDRDSMNIYKENLKIIDELLKTKNDHV